MKKIYFTVTNDLTYDQRMHRICTTLAENGYAVTLIGRKLPSSLPLSSKLFNQKQLQCWFNKGKLFYLEYNLRLINFLFFKKVDAICAIDLDTIIPCYLISKFKKIPRIYDAHELFTELKEVVTRPKVQSIWKWVEKSMVPEYKLGYTVSESIAAEFYRRYGVKYKTIRNVPQLRKLDFTIKNEKFILYQGTVNEGRGFEFLMPAMKWVNFKLIICGDGNFMNQLKKLITIHQLEEKIELKGMLNPEELWQISQQASIGIAVAEQTGLNQYFALPNKFFDYIHACLPQVTMNYPEYKKINQQFEVALLIETLDPEKIAAAINTLINNEVLHSKLKANCLKAREELNWQQEEKKIIAFYQSIFV